MKVESLVSAEALTTFRVGGVVRSLITIEARDEIMDAVTYAKTGGRPLLILGGGSNVRMPDGVLEATMLRYAPSAITFQDTNVCVEAGASWDTLVAETTKRGLWGLENLSAIPGTVGGAVVQNIGAYGAALSETLLTVTVYDVTESRFRTFTKEECMFGYRTSVFKQSLDRYVIADVTLMLTRDGVPNLDYKDLTPYRGVVHSPEEVRERVTEVRATKFPPLSDYGTAGSYFLNPVVKAEVAREIQKKYPDMPVFVLPEGGVKIPLAWYFEHVLKIRGYRVGNVEAWREQALVVATHPGATSSEVKKFVENICDRARDELGIVLVPEVRAL